MVLELQKKVYTKFLRITLIFEKQTVEGHSINQEILTVCIFPHHFYHIDLTKTDDATGVSFNLKQQVTRTNM